LTGILKCGLCESYLKATPKAGQRHYGCKKATGGCGRIFVKADAIEAHVFYEVKLVADSPRLRDAIRSEQSHNEDLSFELTEQIDADEKELAKLRDYYKSIPRKLELDELLLLSRPLQKRIDENTSQRAGLRGQSALDRLGGDIADNWEEMSAADRRLVVQALVESGAVFRAKVQGSNRFDRKRLSIFWRYEGVMTPFVDANGMVPVQIDDPPTAMQLHRIGYPVATGS
jgi:hypothetical protein